ncbi:MAG: thiamine phosphate synthase, partial [Bacteroidales bacterium]|nr:thiamine phosphate synthase [Bacteroidales bacterium]
MLQFTIIKSPLLSEAEQAEMAVKAGCEWIELDTDYSSDAETEKIANEIIPICREAGVILVFKHHDILVDKLRVHGITLSDGDKEAQELRDAMGGHVIIGAEYHPNIQWNALKRADADYVIVNSTSEEMISKVRAEMTFDGLEIPLVASGKMSTTEIRALWEAGASGFNITIDSLLGPDYGASLQNLINFCLKL